jgi:Family of unknown function (DUF6262)
MRADNSHHLVAATRRRREQTLAKARQALQELKDSSQPVTIAGVAARAGVSRAWLYAETDLRQQIEALHVKAITARPAAEPAERATDASLRQRLALANHRIRELIDNNHQLRDQIAHLHGQLRTAKLGCTSVADTVNNTNSQLKPRARSSG